MSSAMPPRSAPPQGDEHRKVSPLAVTIGVLAVVVVGLFLAANIWTEVLWFQQLGFAEVLWMHWGMRAALFVVGFLIMSAAVWFSLNRAFKSRPIYAPSTPEQATLDQYREAIEPLRRLMMIAIPVVLGLFAAGAASSRWEDVLLWWNRGPFGELDPQHNLDLSFYMFTLPVLQFLVSFLLAVVILSLIASIAVHYLYGGVRVGGVRRGESRTTTAARVQLSVLAAVLMVLIAANYWLDRYSILMSSGDRFEGASYADVHAVIPAKAILAGVAILVAALFVVTAIKGNWRLPAIGVGLMLVAAIVIGGIYPAIIQRFQVAPNAQELEAEFIQRNIDATRDAFGINNVEVSQYDAKTEAETGALREDSQTTASIRLLDPMIVSPAFRQLQQNKQYYNFDEALSVDRYMIEGQSRDTVIAVRELNLAGIGADQRNWVNDHTVYTHGYGVVAAYGNQTAAEGQPAFYEGGIPSVGALGDYEPRIYFGQNSPAYSIVGAPEGATPWELDYPDSAEGQVNTTFPTHETSAGPSIGNFASKLLFSLKFGSEQILFSDRVNSESQILYDRDPRDRVAKVAPYLTLDGKVYPAVVDGRVLWIVDGYTTSNSYPYSSSQALDDATTDSLTGTTASIAALAPERVNYIRNSVKATVDAYDGSVTLYAWDDQDPVLKAWSKVYSNSLTDMSEISGDLMSHFRYPEDLFKVQRTLLSNYHVTTATDFFSGQDFWQSPVEPTDRSDNPNKALQPPYYLTLQMPDQDEPTFSLMSTFIPGGNSDRQILTGFLAVDAEAGNTPGKPADGYGTLRLLELPKDSTVSAPGQVQNRFDSDPNVSEQLNILGRGNSTVRNGNLLTLPVGGGLLYVQPVYVQSTGGTQIPLLRKVLVAFGDQIGYADTLDEALDQVFGGDSGAEIGDTTDPEGPVIDSDVPVEVPDEDTDEPAEPVEPAEPTETTEPAEPTETPASPGTLTPRQQLDASLSDAVQAMKDGQAALQDGDFAAYGQAQDALQQALDAALAAEGELE